MCLLCVFIAPGRAHACADVLGLFLGRERIDAALAAELRSLSSNLESVEVALSGTDDVRLRERVAALESDWFAFFSRHAVEPPPDFANDAAWREKMSAVTRDLSILAEGVRAGAPFGASHARFRGVHERFTQVYLARMPLSDADLIGLLKGRLDEGAAFRSETATEPVTLLASRVISLVALLRDRPPQGLSEAERSGYLAAFGRFASELGPLSAGPLEGGIDTAEVSARTKAGSIAVRAFEADRARILSKGWFPDK